MGKIVISQNVTLDGVSQDPTGEEGFRHGGWFTRVGESELGEWAKLGLEEAQAAAALLMGRRSDAYFGPRWVARSGVWADRLNGLPKYVVSSTLVEPLWSNSTVIGGDAVDAVTRLKHDVDGEIVVVASRQLVPTLLEHGLVDEVRMTVFPFVLGSGERFLGDTTRQTSLRLVGTRPVGTALVHLRYEVVR
jgi:dihydrofolate reductase